MGRLGAYVLEHRLIAAKKYGTLQKDQVVRHVNGIKHDNRPENLLIGTVTENNSDHNKSRLEHLFWMDKYTELTQLFGFMFTQEMVKSGAAIAEVLEFIKRKNSKKYVRNSLHYGRMSVQ